MSTPMKLAVLGAGAVTAVGNSLPATAAAIRAGLNNFRDTQFETESGEPVIGAELALYGGERRTRVGGAQRLADALTFATREAIEGARIQQPLPPSVPLLFLGDDHRPAPLVSAAQLCHAALAPMFEKPQQMHLQAFTGGEAGCVDALVTARDFLAKGAPYVLIAAADSWLRASDIAEALSHQRLLNSELGSGFVPGEAAAALVLSRESPGALLHIVGMGLAEETESLLSDSPCTGKGLAQATRLALMEGGLAPHDIHLRMSDAAGEPYFAEELAYAWARLLRSRQPPMHAHLFPASHVGHIGCAFGPLMLALTWHYAKRKRLPGRKVLLQLSSSHTLRGAIAAHAGAA